MMWKKKKNQPIKAVSPAIIVNDIGNLTQDEVTRFFDYLASSMTPDEKEKFSNVLANNIKFIKKS